MRQQSALVEAIALTNDILELLQAGHVDRVSELELRRQPLMHQSFADPVQQIDLIKARHLHNLNQQVVEKLKEFKQSVVTQQALIRTAAKATRAYRSHYSDENKVQSRR